MPLANGDQSIDLNGSRPRIRGGFWNEENWERRRRRSADEGVAPEMVTLPIRAAEGQNSVPQVPDEAPSDGSGSNDSPSHPAAAADASSASSASSSSNSALSQSPSSSLPSAPSPSSSLLALSQNGDKNLRSFLLAIDQSKLALPTSLPDKLKLLEWLIASEADDETDQQQQRSHERRTSLFLSLSFSQFKKFLKIRRKSDPAFVWRNAHQCNNAKGDKATADQLIRKWSTKSNSSGTELVRTLREQFGGRSAGNIANRGGGGGSGRRSTPSSCGQLGSFLVQQSDSAIGSSLGGSCSFLPPPPPYRPPRCSSGSDGAISAIGNAKHQNHPQNQQKQQQLLAFGGATQRHLSAEAEEEGGGGRGGGGGIRQGKDFTSLLGFDCIAMKNEGKDCMEEEEEEDDSRMMMMRRRKRKRASGSDPDEKLLLKNGRSVADERGNELLNNATNNSPSMSASCSDLELQERIRRLQLSRDSLSLQVAVLSRQVALQREKIHDLESLLESKRHFQYHRQFVGEQHEMREQLAELRHKYLALERDKLEAERCLRQSNNELERLGEHSPRQIGPKNNDEELDGLQIVVQRLIADNEQKDSIIQTLRDALEEQQRRMMLHQQHGVVPSSLAEPIAPQQMDISEQIRRILLSDDPPPTSGDHPIAHSNSFPVGLASGQQPHMFPSPPPSQLPNCGPTPVHRHFPASTSYSSALSQNAVSMTPPPPLWKVSGPPNIPPHRFSGNEFNNHQSQHAISLTELPATISNARTPASPLARQLAAELDQLRQQQMAGASMLQHQPYSSASLPRSIHSKTSSNNNNISHLHHQQQPPMAVESDDELISTSASAQAANPNQSQCQLPSGKAFKRGRRARSTLRSFLGRFAHRGNSLQELRPSLRVFSHSTALPSPSTIGGPTNRRPSISQFVDWDQAQCSRWLTDAGFGDAIVGTIRSGRHLLGMSETEMERDLGVRSGLQRKRLRCGLDRIERNAEFEAADRMDTNQVMLWLDQIGLPQLRDIFAESRVDGQLLLALSAQDLIELGIQSALFHASLARGIQFLRSVDFHLHRLERHFSVDILSRCPIPAEVERWGHCCVLEWLKSVDLAEFTPNLAFSGLHGALMVYEPTFTADSLAEMLQIPPNKTLLRRHLNTQFNSLLGQQVIGHKRDILSQPMVTHLTSGLKIRLAKKGFSLSRKKSKSDIFVEPEVRVCPAEGRNGGEEMSDV